LTIVKQGTDLGLDGTGDGPRIHVDAGDVEQGTDLGFNGNGMAEFVSGGGGG